MRKLKSEGDAQLVAQNLANAIATYHKALALKPSDQIFGGVYRSMGIAPALTRRRYEARIASAPIRQDPAPQTRANSSVSLIFSACAIL